MSAGRLLGGRYQVGELLGYGGMAEVHRGRDLRLGRDVAIKMLRTDLARDRTFQERFRREAQNAANAYNGNRGSESYSSVSAGTPEHQFTPATGANFSTILTIDPYKTPGVPASGLIDGVQSYPVGTVGAADAAIQGLQLPLDGDPRGEPCQVLPGRCSGGIQRFPV